MHTPPPPFKFNPFRLQNPDAGAGAEPVFSATRPRETRGEGGVGSGFTIATGELGRSRPMGPVSRGTVPVPGRASKDPILGGRCPSGLWGARDQITPMLTSPGPSLPHLPPPPGSGGSPGGWTMWASNPPPGPAHRPLGARPPAIATLSPGPAASAGVLQTGGRGPRAEVQAGAGSPLGEARLEKGRVQGGEIWKAWASPGSVACEEARRG